MWRTQMESKKIGNIFEGRWKIISYTRPNYTLENIYNGKRIEIHSNSVKRIERGETTISRIICFRLNKERSNAKCIKQVTIKAAQKTMYAIRKERGTL